MLIRSHQSGFSIVELMVALLVSSLLVGSAIMIMSSTINNSQQTINTIRLYQELQGTLELIVNDIRRAGYWANATNDIQQNTNSNPFMTTGTDIQINAGNNCILMSYDTDDNGAIPAINSGTDDERYGYRLSAGAVQARPVNAPFDCNTASNTWEDITDPKNIAITQLQFIKTENAIDIDGSSAGTSTINIRNVAITITGHHVDNPSITKTLSYNVRLRNDKFVP